jgi:membrane protein implicated in regulation of membrane protease activity
MNRMGPMVLVLAAANAVAAAAMAGAVAAVVIFIGIVAAGFLWFRTRPGEESEAESRTTSGPVGRQGVTISRQGAYLLVRLDGRDWPARPAAGAAMPGYGDAVRVEAVEGAVLVVRPVPRAMT